MSNRKIFISSTLAALVWPFVGQGDFRKQLNGLWIEPHETEGVYIVGTNGHVLMVAHDPKGYSNGTHLVNLSKSVVSLCAKRQVKPSAKNDWQKPIRNLQFFDDAVLVCRERGSSELPAFGEPIIKDYVAAAEASRQPELGKAPYPDWRNIFEPALTGKIENEGDVTVTSISPMYLEMAAKVGKAVNQGAGFLPGVEIILTGKRTPCILKFHSIHEYQLMAAIMPMNFEDDQGKPEWLHFRPSNDEKKTKAA